MSKPIRSAFSVEGEGEPIFLIHGIGASRHSFDGLVAALKGEYRCIGYDLRGHGKSPKPKPPYTLEDLPHVLRPVHAAPRRRCGRWREERAAFLAFPPARG